MAKTALWLVCALSILRGEVVDRVAIAVGRHVITQSHLDTEVRVTEFLSDGQRKIDAATARKEAAGRLIQQTLIRREIEITRFPMPKPEDAQPLFEQIRAAHGDNFAKDLKAAGLDSQDLSDHLLWQLTLMRFVLYRFQPGISIGDDEISRYYEAQLPKWAAEGKSAPPLDKIAKEIENLLTQQRVDIALDKWLAEQREQTQIVYRIKGLSE
jgi:hypothetical protein